MYFSAQVNVNSVEADILAARVVSCLSNNGNLNSVNNVLDDCGIDGKLFQKPTNFYLNVTIYGSNGALNSVTAGDSSFQKDCLIKSNISSTYFPGCSIKEVKLVNGGENVRLVVLAGSNQIGVKNSL